VARWRSGLSAFDVHSLTKSRELKLTMMFVQGRLVRPSHRFGQIRIFASALRAPSAKIRPFRSQSAIASRGSRGGRDIDWFRIKRNWIPTSQTAHNPVPEQVFFVAHKQCSKGKVGLPECRITVKRDRKVYLGGRFGKRFKSRRLRLKVSLVEKRNVPFHGSPKLS